MGSACIRGRRHRAHFRRCRPFCRRCRRWCARRCGQAYRADAQASDRLPDRHRRGGRPCRTLHLSRSLYLAGALLLLDPLGTGRFLARRSGRRSGRRDLDHREGCSRCLQGSLSGPLRQSRADHREADKAGPRPDRSFALRSAAGDRRRQAPSAKARSRRGKSPHPLPPTRRRLPLHRAITASGSLQRGRQRHHQSVSRKATRSSRSSRVRSSGLRIGEVVPLAVAAAFSMPVLADDDHPEMSGFIRAFHDKLSPDWHAAPGAGRISPLAGTRATTSAFPTKLAASRFRTSSRRRPGPRRRRVARRICSSARLLHFEA